ncbi:hypothetical protein C8R42DRAFT_718336 [Lentinula raphanica]|nr:hypothetical protein C8R42DRAFT_718336 [Lentinula raphanica]
MVRSRPVFIFVALGAALIATAAPLRLASSVEPASQEAASCAHFDQDTQESANPHDCSEIELNVSSGEHYVLDMNSFPSRRDSSGINPLLPFDSPLSQDHADAVDTASVLGIASRALHPSGPLEVVGRSNGVLSSGTSHTPDAHPLLRNRAETDIAGADDTGSPARRITVPLQPTRAFPTSFPFVVASPDPRKDALDEEGNVVTTHSIASDVPYSLGPLDPSSASIVDPLLRMHTGTDIAGAHSIESRSPHPPGPHSGAPIVVSADMQAYYIMSKIHEDASPEEVVNAIKFDTRSYDTDIQGRTSWAHFLDTNTGKSWLAVDRVLKENRPTIDRDSVQIMIKADIILDRLKNYRATDEYFLRNVYSVFRVWNDLEYWDATGVSGNWDNFLTKHTGKLLLRVYDLLGPENKAPFHQLKYLRKLVDEDIEHLSPARKADQKMQTLRTYDGCTTAATNARGHLGLFVQQNSRCFAIYRYEYLWSTTDVQVCLQEQMTQWLVATYSNSNRAIGAARQH